MSILDLQGLPLPEAKRGTSMGPQNSELSVAACSDVQCESFPTGSDDTQARS